MQPADIYDELVRWTPFLGGGFAWNIVISLAAMALGTVVGAVLAVMREHGRGLLMRSGLTLTELARNIPTFVFLFYVAYLLPPELHLAGLTIPCPGWVKASLALSIAVVGYVSDTLSIVLRDWRAGRHDSALLFLPSWTTYLLIIVMASSTASVIGVNEIVARCNTVVAATGNNALLVWIYLYAMLWFFLFCYPLFLVMDRVKARLARRIRTAAASRSRRRVEAAEISADRNDRREGALDGPGRRR
jgi:polar amino acid transport system permease protein